MSKYSLTLTEKQSAVLVKALDLYSRIHILQLEEICNVLLWNTISKDLEGNVIEVETIHLLKKLISDFKEQHLGIPLGASHGIHSRNVSDEARIAFDIQQVVRHKLAWDSVKKDPTVDNRSPEMFTVDFNEPMKTSTNHESLPEIRST